MLREENIDRIDTVANEGMIVSRTTRSQLPANRHLPLREGEDDDDDGGTDHLFYIVDNINLLNGVHL